MNVTKFLLPWDHVGFILLSQIIYFLINASKITNRNCTQVGGVEGFAFPWLPPVQAFNLDVVNWQGMQ